MAHSNFCKRSSKFGHYGMRAKPQYVGEHKGIIPPLMGLLVAVVASLGTLGGCAVYVPAQGRSVVHAPPPPVYASRPTASTLRITCGPIGISGQIITAPYRNPHDGVWSCSSVTHYPTPVPTNCPRPNVYAWDIENNRYRGVGCG